jgi:hypothetical protein
MPLARHGRPRRCICSRHAAAVLPVAHWLRRGTQRYLSASDKYSIPVTSRDVMCAYLRRIIYADLPAICSSLQWRTNKHVWT